MNPTRVSYIVDTLQSAGVLAAPPTTSGGSDSIGSAKQQQQPLRGLRALDVGCGGGLLSESLARLGATVTAIDPSVEVANAAREHSKHHPLTPSIDYRGGMSVEDLATELCDVDDDVNNDDFASAPEYHRQLFDLVCVLEVVEHASDPRKLLHNASRLVRPGGVLFVSTINRTAKSYVLAIAGAEHVMRMVPVGTHTWDKFLSPAEVGEMVVTSSSPSDDFEVMDVCGMVLAPPFFNMKWKLDRNDTDMNWIGAYRRKT